MQILLGATNAKINEAEHVPSWNEFMCYSTEWIRFINNSYSVVNTFRVGNVLYLYMFVAIVLKQCVLHCMHSCAWCCNNRTLKKKWRRHRGSNDQFFSKQTTKKFCLEEMIFKLNPRSGRKKESRTVEWHKQRSLHASKVVSKTQLTLPCKTMVAETGF